MSLFDYEEDPRCVQVIDLFACEPITDESEMEAIIDGLCDDYEA